MEIFGTEDLNKLNRLKFFTENITVVDILEISVGRIYQFYKGTNTIAKGENGYFCRFESEVFTEEFFILRIIVKFQIKNEEPIDKIDNRLKIGLEQLVRDIVTSIGKTTQVKKVIKGHVELHKYLEIEKEIVKKFLEKNSILNLNFKN